MPPPGAHASSAAARSPAVAGQSHTCETGLNQTSAKHEAGTQRAATTPSQFRRRETEPPSWRVSASYNSAPVDCASARSRAPHGLPAPVRQYWQLVRARRTCSIRTERKRGAARGSAPAGPAGGRAAAPSPEALAAAEWRGGEKRAGGLWVALRGSGGVARAVRRAGASARSPRPHQKISHNSKHVPRPQPPRATAAKFALGTGGYDPLVAPAFRPGRGTRRPRAPCRVTHHSERAAARRRSRRPRPSQVLTTPCQIEGVLTSPTFSSSVFRHAHARARTNITHTRTHTHTHACTLTRARARVHTHTHTHTGPAHARSRCPLAAAAAPPRPGRAPGPAAVAGERVPRSALRVACLPVPGSHEAQARTRPGRAHAFAGGPEPSQSRGCPAVQSRWAWAVETGGGASRSVELRIETTF